MLAHPSPFKHLADLVDFHTPSYELEPPQCRMFPLSEVSNDNMATRELVRRERTELHGRTVMKLCVVIYLG